MEVRRKRRKTAKRMVSDICGKNIDRCLLSSSDKLAIMEFLLLIPRADIEKYMDVNLPNFVIACAMLIKQNNLQSYMMALDSCRKHANEDRNK